jgi:hypothetical protein
MDKNGDSPSLEDVRALLERDGHHAVLLPIRAGEKGPRDPGWQNLSYAQTQNLAYQSRLASAVNTGVLLGEKSSDLCAIDCDTDAFVSAFLALAPQFNNTLRTRGARGCQLWAYVTGQRPKKICSLKVKPDSALALGGKPPVGGLVQVGEFRAEGGQSVIRGIHPTGCHYRWLCSHAPITIDFGEIPWSADLILPWDQKARYHFQAGSDGTHQNDDYETSLLQRAKARLSIDLLWTYFGYQQRLGNPTNSPFREDNRPSFSIYDDGRHFKDHGNGDQGDTFDFYQRATKHNACQAFPGFVELAGLGSELGGRQKSTHNNKGAPPTQQKEEPQSEADSQAEIRAEAKDQDQKDDDRPLIMHPRDKYISEFARELGGILKEHGFYQFHGRAVQVRLVTVKTRNGKENKVKQLVQLEVPQFSTLIELYCRPVVATKTVLKAKSISLEIASRTLVCVSFIEQLPIIKLWTNVRLPVRVGEEIVLSRPGYDSLSGVYTSPDAPAVDETLSIEQAAQSWRNLMAEFCFPKSGKTPQQEPDPRKREPEIERCIAVALAAALTPFCLNLLPEKSKRPGFAASANSEGAGKTLLLSFGMVAMLGYVPTGSAPQDEEEMRKILDAAVDSGVLILFLDNLKNHVNSGELESFITSSTRRFRRLGSTNYSEAENLSTIYLTANFATYSSDLRRRLLCVELILQEARAEERQIKNFLDEDKLVKMRSHLLSIFWAFVRRWYEKGECSPKKLLPSFESWTQIVAGIVEAAEFASPCQQTSLKTGGDTVTQDMEKLISEMNPDSEYRFSDLVDLARDHQLFARLIPEEGDMEKDKSTRLSLLIRKFIDRIFTVHEKLDTGEFKTRHFRFCLTGETPKTRRFFIRGQD